MEPLHLGLVLTGGTVGSEYSADDIVRIPLNDYAPWNAELKLISEAWEQQRPELVIHPCQPLRTLSENLVPEDWLAITKDIRTLMAQHDISGLLVLHGTDTAAYTAAALSFLLRDVNVPIVITGSNLPPNQSGSDAVTNIRHALIALSHLPRGVYLSFAGDPKFDSLVHLGTCVRKVKASGQAFKSVNREPVGIVGEDGFELVSPTHAAQSAGTTFTSQRVDPKVLSFRLYPGLDLDLLWAGVSAGVVHGVVMELYASATGPAVPGRYSLPTFVRRCTDAGIPVFGCVAEAADEEVNLYDSSVDIAEAGAVLLDDVLPETATVKLMWILGETRDPLKVREVMVNSVAGERARA